MSPTPLGPAPLQTYEDACRFVESLDVSTMKLGLERIRHLLATLGNPQDSLPMVHIAGTNGKGSVAAMLSSILKDSGLMVGTFTSPHLVHLRERIAINGNPILPDDFTFEVNQLRQHLNTLGWAQDEWPTYFEFLNTIAYLYFKRKNVDITVFEAGLGGRLDSTNVVRHPNLTLITHIGWDHMQHLGDTMAKIAGEKAGILKIGSPLIIGPNLPEEALRVITDRAQALDVPVSMAEAGTLQVQPPADGNRQTIMDTASGTTYALGLLGAYQSDNLASVLEAVRLLRQQGFVIPEFAVQEGLKHTHWPARFQVIVQRRLVLDGSHNQAGFETLAQSLQIRYPGRPLALMLSLRHNRPAEALLRPLAELGAFQHVIFTTGQPEHLYHGAESLQEASAPLFGANVTRQVVPDAVAALESLERWLAQHPDAIGVATGSLYTAGTLLGRL